MADGWRCPECALILAPDVREHRCDPPSGGVAVRPVAAPYLPPGTSTLPYPQTVTVAPGTTYWGSVGGGGGGGSGGWSPPAGATVRVTAGDSPSAHWLCTSAWPEVPGGDRAA